MAQVLNLLTDVSQPSVLGLDISNMTGTAAVPIFHMAHLYYSPLECKVFFSSEQYIKKPLTGLHDFKYRFSSSSFFLILL